MIDGFSFLQQDLIVPVIMGGVLLLAAYIFKEWKAPNKGRFILNSLIALVSILSLALLILEPTKEVELQHKQGLLLTDGFSKKQQDSLEGNYKGIQVLEYNSKKSIRSALDSLTNLIIIGNGVEPYDFYAFDSLPTTYIPNKIQSGITQLDFTKQIVLGDDLQVKGKISKPIEGSFLILQDSRGNGLDSIGFKENSTNDFMLKSVPKVSGDFVFLLTEKDSVGKVLKSNPLPITIQEKEKVNILIVNTFPTFETKYLKNFLADAGYEVTVRSQLTKGKYKFEYFNTKASPVYQFTKESLNTYEVVIADAETYFNFGTSVKHRFENSIRENGLGLLIQPSDWLFNLGANTSYFTFKRDGINEIQLPNTNITLEKYPFKFTKDFATNVIRINGTTDLSFYKQMGLGRVATTTMLNSYQLLLHGKDQVYKNIWTQILDNVVKQKEQSVQWQSLTEIPKVDGPFSFVLRTGLEELSIVHTDKNRVSLLQNSTVPFKYTGTTYPTKKRWNTLKVESDSTPKFSYYVYGSDDWKSLSAFKNRAANTKHFSAEVKENRAVVINSPMSPILFYILFLLGVGWLWLSPKISNHS